MISTIISYNEKGDVNSKEKVPVIIFGEVITYVELGLYAKWANKIKKNGGTVPPIGSYLNGKIRAIRGEVYQTKEELLRELPLFESKYTLTIEEYINKTLQDVIDEN